MTPQDEATAPQTAEELVEAIREATDTKAIDYKQTWQDIALELAEKLAAIAVHATRLSPLLAERDRLRQAVLTGLEEAEVYLEDGATATGLGFVKGIIAALKEAPDDVHSDRRDRDDVAGLDAPVAGPAGGAGAVRGRVADPPGRSLAESVERLSTALDEPQSMFGGKSMREMLGGKR